MKSATKDREYKSPVRKLARFFEKSRDQWKAKCREANGMCQAFWDNSDGKLVSNGCVQLGCSTAFPTVARCSAASRDRYACPSGTLDPACASGSVR
jgi:hypothetical protein